MDNIPTEESKGYCINYIDHLLYEIYDTINEIGEIAIKKQLNSQWDDLGAHLLAARQAAGISQATLAERAGLRQRDISLMEKGHWQPSLRILTNIARHLDVPVQYFINGSTQPEYHPHQLTLELRHLGIIDLDISQAIVPGAFRNGEEVLILSLAGERPDPRVVEALPYVMLKHQWQIDLMVGYARKHDRRALYRVAWLAEIALVIQDRLSITSTVRILKSLSRLIKRARKPDTADSLGLPSLHPEKLPAYYKRWNITYAASLSDFSKRGQSLHDLAKQYHRSSLRTVSE